VLQNRALIKRIASPLKSAHNFDRASIFVQHRGSVVDFSADIPCRGVVTLSNKEREKLASILYAATNGRSRKGHRLFVGPDPTGGLR